MRIKLQIISTAVAVSIIRSQEVPKVDALTNIAARAATILGFGKTTDAALNETATARAFTSVAKANRTALLGFLSKNHTTVVQPASGKGDQGKGDEINAILSRNGGAMKNGTVGGGTVCQPMSSDCSTKMLLPLLGIAHDPNVTEEVKDGAVITFCNDPCGFRYTERADAVLRGRCQGDATGQKTLGKAAGHNALRRAANTTVDSVGEEESDDPRETFLQDRVGVALGCMSDQFGELCALKRGCKFWTSCCFSSWMALAITGGFQPDSTFLDSLNDVCPGAPKFLRRGGCL